MITRLVHNTEHSSHNTVLKKILNGADEVLIAVAFLKSSGLRLLLPYIGEDVKFTIIAGANFGLTEPKALRKLLSVAKIAGRVFPYLNSLGAKQVFHPKMYLVRKGDEGHIVIGSANVTNGGLACNNEISLYHKCSLGDNIWKKSISYYNSLILPQNADPLSERIIDLYETYYLRQKNIIDRSSPCPDKLEYILHKLRLRYDEMDKHALTKAFREKKDHYNKARDVLERMINRPNSQKDFNELLEQLVGRAGQYGWWHSSGMHRHKRKIFRNPSLFIRLIKMIKNNVSESPGDLYDRAKAITDQIYGVGPNFIGEIMMTYAPDRLANINRNPLTVLNSFGAELKGHTQSFNGADYEKYNSIVDRVMKNLGLNNMLEVDYFFNTIYMTIPSK